MADDAAHAFVLAIRLVDFAAQPVADQAASRERLEAMIARAIAGIPPAERIVLDAAEGAVVVFLGDAAAALAAGDAALAAAADGAAPVALGLNAGPAKPVNATGHANVIGDGVAAALATAGFATAGELLATRAFRDAVSPDHADRFADAGERTDASLRPHQVYRCKPAAPSHAPGRRRLLRTLATSAVVLLAGGAAVRTIRQGAAERRKPARVALAITPWAEVSVDGVARGRTPPLQTLELPAGRHTIAIRHGNAAPLLLDLDLEPGEETTVRHAFAVPPQAPAAKPRAPQQQSLPERVRGFFRNLGR